MNLRKAFLIVSLSLTGLLVLIGMVTLGALSSFDQGIVVAKHRQQSIALVNEIRHEVDLLGRLVSSYVSTANPRFLIYYYDILAIREGSKPRPENLPAAYWEQVIAGATNYLAPTGSSLQPLVERTSQLGFDVGEQALVRQIHQVTEKMKQTEQIAFAATQGLYDPEKMEFVSEAEPQPEFASRLLHQAPYLKLRADLAVAVEALSTVVDQRTAQKQQDVEQALRNWIISAIFLLMATSAVLILSYRYLQRFLLVPLSKLHQTAQALTAKSYGERVGRIRGVDEVRSLATTIDGMAAAIQADFAQRELAERALREARSRAEVATEAKSIFLANMSHEIRTPMNAILGMAYLAMKSGLPPRQHDYVSKIHAAARSLLGILNDILDFSKIEAGKVVLEETPFDIEPVVQNALFMVQQRAEGKGVELILDYALPSNFPMVMGDQLRIGQVLINLLSNAVKFTESGHVSVRVDETVRDGQVSRLCFRIEDTGIGMTGAQIEQLFQEFTQADGSTTRKYGGTGLGLSISKRLAQAMGGQITVESQVDRGSRFDFTIPLPIVQGGVLDVDAESLDCSRALVVDDYPAALESMAAVLRLMGCPQVDEAATGDDALTRLQDADGRGQPYDLLLLDWRMPGMSGGQLIEAARQRGIALPGRTIVVSAADISLLRAEVTHPEVCDVIQKPLLPNILRRICAGVARPSSAPEPRISRNIALSGMKILLVEDNEVNQQVASEILQSWGASVDIVANGQLALDVLMAKDTTPYHVVLMDLEMPVMSGHQATKHLRSDSRFKDLPIIAMTAHAAGAELQRTADEGMNGYIAKPFEPDELLAKLRPYLGRHLPASASASAPSSVNAVAEQQFMAALAVLPEFDVPVLLRRFNGRVPALAHALRRFVEDSRGFVLKLKSSLAQGDLDAACGQAHTFKGLVGTFAVPLLQHAAIELEAALKSGIVEPAKEIAAVQAMLEPLLDKLVNLKLASNNQVQTAKLHSTDAFLRLLRQYLSEGDGEAEELWNANRPSLDGLYTPLQLARIERAISQWNFDEALAVLAISLEDEEAA